MLLQSIKAWLDNELDFNGNILIANTTEKIFAFSRGVDYSPYGYSSLHLDSVFETASISKQFTWYLAHTFIEKGLLEQNADIREYIPGFPYPKISAGMLLNHTSGLSDYFEVMDRCWNRKRIAFNRDLLQIFIKEKPGLLFNSGDYCCYSNTGYAFLATILEKISGKPFEKLFREMISVPLKLEYTFVSNKVLKPVKGFKPVFGVLPGVSKGTIQYPDKLDEFDFVNFLGGITGDGCVHSTVNNLWKWNKALFEIPGYKETLIQYISQPDTTKKGQKIPFKHGWVVDLDGRENRLFFQGAWPGFFSYSSYCLKMDFSIIILSNKQIKPSEEDEIINKLEDILYF